MNSPCTRRSSCQIADIGSQIAVHDLTPAMMADPREKIDAAEGALPALRGIVIEKQAATAGLEEALRRLAQLEKDRILPLLVPLRKSAPEFYLRYELTREVRSRRRHRAAQEAVVTAAKDTAEESRAAGAPMVEVVRKAA